MDLSPSISPDAAGLKTLAHPMRLKMLMLLRLEGPATASSLAIRLDLNTGATSYHLRQLAEHGFITDDPARGNARERWWVAAHRSTRTGSDDVGTADDPDGDAQQAYLQTVALLYVEQLQSAVAERRTLPEEWRRATTLSDWVLRLSPARAKALLETLVAVVEEIPEEDVDDEFVIQLQAFPRPGTVS